MKTYLPADLKQAKMDLYKSLICYMNEGKSNRINVNLKFEGIKLLPLVSELHTYFVKSSIKSILAWPDAGAAALCRSKLSDESDKIVTFKEAINSIDQITYDTNLIAVSPQYYDYEEFLELSNIHTGNIIMINGRLEDPALGIGSVGRQRRKSFIDSWDTAYWLQPLSRGALMRAYPDQWTLFKSFPEGYKLINEFEKLPDQGLVNEFLN